MKEITTARGTTVTVVEDKGETLIVSTNEDNPPGLTTVVIGTVENLPDIGPGFQPARRPTVVLGPDVLRAIIELIETAPR